KISDRDGTGVAVPERNISFPEVISDATTNANGSQQGDVAANDSGPRQQRRFNLWENDDFSFGDIVDIINPLQHLPIVATLYRKMTDDKIGLAPRVIGGALWGRIGGLVSGLINAGSEWLTGKDVGDHVYTALFGPHSDSGTQTRVAKPARAGETTESTVGGIIAQAQSSFPGFNDDGGFSPGP